MENVRIGTTSYILADEILPNVRYLAPLVDDIELVLFKSEGQDNYPSVQVIEELRSIAVEHDLTYTVHFPLDVFPGSRDRQERQKSLETYLKVIELTAVLQPFAYVLHLTPDTWSAVPSQDVEGWQNALDESLADLLRCSSLDPSLVCVETLSYPFSYVLPLVEKHKLSVTLDIGHIWLMGYDEKQTCSTLLPKTRVCHLHGVCDGKDHQSLAVGKTEKISYFLDALDCQGSDGKERVLTLEVFNEYDFSTSLTALGKNHAMIGKRGDQ
ncbi:sugar phosphate isomerase/epimerase [Sphaerochaeta pleomorpha str. Grapes]|uniref:Sugar phosphate isomerase/epimerase n=1 Tax=Sphaerochaeta pleomorpha (strain ATCC BAA-1885 / DSM 22778 / Grapes) TaxID=158190 RepID=G8QSJ8_SPHPG|nr:cobamide remodeling phosphodiesterase CbiR [Sphaerochaeta pleomorpha]AEV28959.1 sugar phosphate isomerase/epimerase [Sphaerochaeta pleomorpha str. Grapes]